MKKFAFLCLTIGAFMTSCSNDDDSSNSGNIVGKWAFDTTTVNNGTPIPYDDHEACGQDYFEFKSDNTYIVIDVWDCELDVADYGTYSKNNNQLTIVSDGESFTVDIIELTNSKLKFQMDEDYDGDGDDDIVVYSFNRI